MVHWNSSKITEKDVEMDILVTGERNHDLLVVCFEDGLINYVDTKVKCRNLKKLASSPTLFICLSPHPLLGYCLGWSTNFVGSESGQIQSVKLQQNTVWSSTGINTPTNSQTHTVFIYFEPERSIDGQQFTKVGRKYQHDWLYIQSINSDKHLLQSPFTGQFY